MAAAPTTVLAAIEALELEDLGFLVLRHLNAQQDDGWRAMVALGRASKFWRRICTDEVAWVPVCNQLWASKVRVCPEAIWLLADSRGHTAFARAWTDSKRVDITYDEIVATDWSFRFKQAAGSHFQTIDPHANGMDALVNLFGPTDTDGGGREIRCRPHENPVINVMLNSVYRTWRFVDEAGVDIVTEPGAASRSVRATVNGNDTPTYLVSRHSNWGFLMQSCWVVYTSWPMPRLGDPADPELDDENMKVTIESQGHEASRYNFDGYDDDDSGSDDSDWELEGVDNGL